jgi:hypothetical protein
MFASKERLLKLFQEDEHLNNIPLEVFDAYFPVLKMYHREEVKKFGPDSFAENCCMYKHALIYQVIGAEPEFTDPA